MDGGEAGAAVEGPFVDAGEAGAEYDIGEGGAIGEGLGIEPDDGIGENDFGEAGGIGKGFGADGGDGVALDGGGNGQRAFGTGMASEGEGAVGIGGAGESIVCPRGGNEDQTEEDPAPELAAMEKGVHGVGESKMI